MPKPQPDDPALSKRFVELAEKLEADTDPQEFMKKLRAIAPVRPAPKKKGTAR